MRNERRRRIEELFHAASSLAPDARAGFLDEHCGGDASLRSEVEALLHHDAATEALPVRPLLNGEGAAPAHPAEGAWIAGYRILGKLGEGGMGVVYEAEQQSPRRNVALKVIRGGAFVSEQQIRLFEREEQSLARLKHPGIGAIYDAGRTEEGQHYFAMELVQGLSLDEYILQNPLASSPRRQIEDRLALFLQICDAIGYAHQKGVLHRDLKPSNIMVLDAEADESSTGSGFQPRIKVLDFGVARIMDAEGETAYTEAGGLRGTLAYMSPEQARADTDQIDVRSDVYALGVILYRLLTEGHPYNIDPAKIHDAIRTICETAPEHPAKAQEMLRGDLATIVLKALEKDPEQRYQSALALAEDIRRFQNNEPILAHAPSMAYQLRKLVVRHKLPVAFASALLALLIAFAITMSFLFESQRRAKTRALLESQKAERINEFLTGMLSSADPGRARGEEVSVRQVLEQASAEIGTELEDQPEVRASVQSTLGNTYRALGLYDDAERHLEGSLETRWSALGEDHADVAASLHELAMLHHDRGEFAQAESLTTVALRIWKRELGERHPKVADALNDLGRHLKAEGRYDEAGALFRQALAIRRDAYGEDHSFVAKTLNDLGSLHQALGEYAEAEPLYRRAFDIHRRRLGADHPEVAATLNNLADVLRAQGKYAEAEPIMRDALDLSTKLYGEEHVNVARTRNNLAGILRMQGKYEDAEQIYLEALSGARAAFGEGHPAVAAALNNLASLYLATERYAEAEPLYEETLAMRREIYGERHPAVATAIQNLAILEQRQGDYTASEELYRTALAMRRELLGNRHPSVSNSLLGLGTLLLDTGTADRAEPLLRECLELRRAEEGENPYRIASAESALGACLVVQERYEEAERLLLGSLAVIESSTRASDLRKAEAARRVVDLYDAWGRSDEAERYRAR